MFPTIPDKTYFKIGEAAEIVDVKPYIIRYWESEFRALKPAKTKSQQRLFRRKDIELLLVIRTLLYDHKFTTEGARQKLRELSDAGRSPHEILDSLAQGEIPTTHHTPPPLPVAPADTESSLREELRLAHEKLALQKRKLDDFSELLRAERAASRTHAEAADALRAEVARRDETIAEQREQLAAHGAAVLERALAALEQIDARLRQRSEPDGAGPHR